MRIDEGHIMLMTDIYGIVEDRKKQYPDWDFEYLTEDVEDFVNESEYDSLRKWYVIWVKSVGLNS